MEPIAIPKTQRALIGTERDTLELTDAAPVPTPGPGWVLVKNVAVGLNPIDTKLTSGYTVPGAIGGFDCAGVVVALGPPSSSSSTTQRPLAVGDEVGIMVLGMNRAMPDVGAFSQYVLAQEDFVLRKPPGRSLAEMAPLGTVFMAAGLAMRRLELPGTPLSPSTTPHYVLVYGGGTATGTIFCQLTRLAGFLPIAVCSPRSYELAKSCQAVACFDYNDPDGAVDAIKKLTKGCLKYAFDCIGSVDSARFCFRAIGRMGGHYETVHVPHEAITRTRKTVKSGFTYGLEMAGLDIDMPPPHGRPGNPELRKFGVELARTLEGLLHEGKIITHPIKVYDTGLPGALQGLEEIKAGTVRGHKLVYTGV